MVSAARLFMEIEDSKGKGGPGGGETEWGSSILKEACGQLG